MIKPLFQKLKKNPTLWTNEHTQVVKQVKELPCLGILHPEAFSIIETDASNIGYGGILKQDFENKISIVRFHSGVWSGPQINYSTVNKEILAIVLCIQKFQPSSKMKICVMDSHTLPSSNGKYNIFKSLCSRELTGSKPPRHQIFKLTIDRFEEDSWNELIQMVEDLLDLT